MRKLEDMFIRTPGTDLVELQWLYNLAREHSNEHQYNIEIGSFAGRSTLALGAGGYHALGLICIDAWKWPIPNWNCTAEQAREFFNDNLSWLREFGARMYVCEGLSTDIPILREVTNLVTVSHNPPAIVFVDGDHTFEGVSADILNYVLPLSQPGTIAVFHDLHPDSQWPGVAEAIQHHLPTLQWAKIDQCGWMGAFKRV